MYGKNNVIGQTLLGGNKSEGMFMFHLAKQHPSVLLATGVRVSLMIWHNQLGYPSPTVLRSTHPVLPTINNINVLPFCYMCSQQV